MITSQWHVRGMTCDHCVKAVVSEIAAIPGVEDVVVELLPGDDSIATVTSSLVLDVEALRGAVDEAGYELIA